MADVVVAGRRAAEMRMVDHFTALAPDGNVLDVTGYEVPAYVDRGTTLGKIQAHRGGRDNHARTTTIAGVEREVIESGLHLPIAATPPTVGYYGIGWEYVCTSIGPGTDPSLLGSRWLALDAPAKSYATARRLTVVRLI